MSLFALAAVMAVSSVGVVHAATQPTGNDVKRYTAEEYYDGVFFAMGPVAELLPELHRQDVPDQVTGDSVATPEVAAKLRARVEAQSPGSVASFAATVVSGDRVAIRKAVIDGADQLSKAYADLFPDKVDTNLCSALFCGIAFAVAIVAAVWLWVAIAEANYVFTDPGQAELYFDHVTEIIATKLRVR